MVNFRGFFLPKEENSKSDGASSEPDTDSDNDDFENPDYRDIVQIAGGKCQPSNASKTRCVAEKATGTGLPEWTLCPEARRESYSRSI